MSLTSGSEPCRQTPQEHKQREFEHRVWPHTDSRGISPLFLKRCLAGNHSFTVLRGFKDTNRNASAVHISRRPAKALGNLKLVLTLTLLFMATVASNRPVLSVAPWTAPQQPLPVCDALASGLTKRINLGAWAPSHCSEGRQSPVTILSDHDNFLGFAPFMDPEKTARLLWVSFGRRQCPPCQLCKECDGEESKTNPCWQRNTNRRSFGSYPRLLVESSMTARRQLCRRRLRDEMRLGRGVDVLVCRREVFWLLILCHCWLQRWDPSRVGVKVSYLSGVASLVILGSGVGEFATRPGFSYWNQGAGPGSRQPRLPSCQKWWEGNPPGEGISQPCLSFFCD